MKTTNKIKLPPSHFKTLGTWNNDGKPDYLTLSDSLVDQTLVKRILNTVPENINKATTNPNYFLNSTSRNLIIQTTDPTFVGAEVFVSFVYEDAGFKNVVGYYYYDISRGNTGPMIPDNYDSDNINSDYNDYEKYVPLDYSYLNSRNLSKEAVTARQKNVCKLLNKTIIFPNASGMSDDLIGLPSDYISPYHGGGSLKLGDTVQIYYYDSNGEPQKLWPNNISIGFFIIPNGWAKNGSLKESTYEHIHSDNILNPTLATKKRQKYHNKFLKNMLSCDTNGFVQTINFHDAYNISDAKEQVIIVFDNFLRNNGNRNTNDCIIKVSYTPIISSNLTNKLVLSNNEILDGDYTKEIDFDKSQIICDKSGIYIYLPNYVVNMLSSQNEAPFNSITKYRFTVSIVAKDSNEYDKLKTIFQNINYEYNGMCISPKNASDTNDYGYYQLNDAKNNIIRYRFVVDKNLVQSIMYIMKPRNNANKQIRNQYGVLYDTVLSALQRDYIFGNNVTSTAISLDYTTDIINTNAKYTTYRTIIVPFVSKNMTPSIFGDPHIISIYGKKVDLLEIGNYNLYTDNLFSIICNTNTYPLNFGTEYEDFLYVEHVYINYKNQIIDIDLYNLTDDTNIVCEFMKPVSMLVC